MDSRTLFRSGSCVLVAVLSAGCVGTRPGESGPPRFFPSLARAAKRDKSDQQIIDNSSAPIGDPAQGPGTPSRGGTPSATGSDMPPSTSGVVPTGGVAPSGGPAPSSAGGPLPSTPLPMPLRVQPGGPPTGQAADPQAGSAAPGSTGSVPSSTPGMPGSPTPPPQSGGAPLLPGPWLGGSVPPFGPHVRSAPTAAGSLLNLGPGEVPTDRVVELARQLETATLQNQSLMGRIRDLEAAGLGREQALTEALREVEAASAEVAQARVDMQALRKEIGDLRERLEQVEKEDVETLRLVIAALERLLQQPAPGAGRAVGGRELP